VRYATVYSLDIPTNQEVFVTDLITPLYFHALARFKGSFLDFQIDFLNFQVEKLIFQPEKVIFQIDNLVFQAGTFDRQSSPKLQLSFMEQII
jgi:hypothetical protein